MKDLGRLIVMLVAVIWLGAGSGAAMSAVAFQAAGVAVSGVGSVAPAWPTHLTGDIALLFVESAGGEAVAAPAGFAAVTGSPQSIGTLTTGTRLSVFWARATSAAMPAPTVTDPGDHVYAQIITYRGAVAAGNPWDVTGGGITPPRSLTLGAVTTTVANTRVVQAASRDNDSTAADFSVQTNANLSGITERSDAGTTSGTGGGFAVWDGVKASAGSIGTTTTALAASISNAYLTIALSPSGASAPTFQALGTAVSGTGAVTAAWPAHAIGDIALLFVESAGGEAVTLSTPATFVAVPGSPQSIGTTTAGTRLSVFWARATSTTMASAVVADPGNHVYARIVTYRGVVASGNPWNVTGGGTDSSLAVSGVTTTVANTLVVQAASRDDDSAAVAFSAQTNANLSGIAVRSDAGTTSGSGGGFAVWDGGKASAGATGNTTVTRAVTTTSVVGNPFLTIALKPFTPPLHHIRIAHNGGACSGAGAPASVTLTACANVSCTAPHYADTDVTGINLSPTGAGYTWSPSSTVSILAASGGINSSITLARSTAGTATLATTGTPSPVPSNAYECYNTASGTSGDCNLVFSTDSFTYNVADHTADTRQVVTLTSCKGAFSGATRNVKFWSTYLNPATGTQQGKIVAGTGNADCATGYAALSTSSGSPTTLSLAFGSGTAPQTTFSLCYPDAGQVQVDTRYDGSGATGDAGTVLLGNDSFIAAPHHFTLSNIVCGDGGGAFTGCQVASSPYANPGAADASGARFTKAGNPFGMTVTAYNTNGAITPNFGKETSPEGVSLTPTMIADPDLGTTGTISGAFGAFSGGAASGNSFSFSEVGIMTLVAELASASYLGSGIKEITTPSSGNIGRFIPDHFTVTPNPVNPIRVRAGTTQTVVLATATAAPATVINVDTTTGFAVGDKVRIPGAGAGGTAFTATVTAINPGGPTLTLDTAIGTTLVGGESVIEEWGSYMGETMNAQFELKAVSLGGTTTANYQGAYAKLDPATVGALNFGAVNAGTNLTARLNTSIAPTVTSNPGAFTITAPLGIGRDALPDGPYAALQIGIAPTDSDGVIMTQPYDLNVGGTNDHTSIMSATAQATTEVRFGRLRLINAYGSELLKPRVDYRLEYWDGTRWTANTVDSWAPFVAGNVYDGGLGAPSSVTGPTGGTGVITFNTAAVGSFDIAVNLNAAGNDTSCNVTGHGGTAANKPWLQGFWSAKASCNNTDPWLQDPNARVKLGSPKAPYIYYRERY